MTSPASPILAPAKTAAPSPLAPERFPELPPIAGVRLAAANCGIRYQGRRDLMVALLDPGTTVAGVFTRSLTPGAPVDWCRAALKRGKARAIVVNSGNANVFTGRAGRQVVEETAKAMAKIVGCDARGVHRLDRRHRRAAAAREDHRRLGAHR